MQLETGWETFSVEERRARGYVARPARAEGPLPAVVVIQEVWGVDAHIADVADRIATAGYLAVAPDLYAEGGERPPSMSAERISLAKGFMDSMAPGVWLDEAKREEALGGIAEPDRSAVRETLGAVFAQLGRMEDFVGTLADTVTWLGGDPRSAPRPIGCVGFCMGGALSARLACASAGVSAAAIFYGNAPSEAELEHLACPLIGFYGGDDERVNAGIPAMAESIAGRGGSFETHTYPGVPHAFFNDTRPSHRLDAARDAWARTLRFFAEHLTG